MAVATSLDRHLGDRRIDYDLITHSPAWTSVRSAWASHISPDQVAKAVLLKDGDGYLLAVLPASHRICFKELECWLGRKLSLAKENELDDVFPDCEIGAVPAIGEPYGLDVVLDKAMSDQGEVYIEGGDHLHLVHIKRGDFESLMKQAKTGYFSSPN